MKKYLIGGVALLFAVTLLIAAKPYGMTHFSSLWIGDKTGTASPTPGDDDLHVVGRITMGTADLAETMRIPIQLASVTVDGGNDIDDGSTPALSTADNVGCILYDDSSETTEIQFNWSPSANYVDGMQVQAIVSSDTADADNSKSLDWCIWVHDHNADFDSAIAQTHATTTSTTLDASTELLTLSLNSTGEAAITAGSSMVTIALWFSGETGDTGNFEIKGITILEPVL